LKSFRDESGKSTTRREETLGTEEEIEEKYNCPDGLEWAKAYVAELNEKERLGQRKVKVEFSPTERINANEQVLFDGGDLMLLPLYNRLGLPEICDTIKKGSRVKYNVSEILEALVMLRILYPCSKRSSFELNRKRIRKSTFELEHMYRALSLLSSHIDDIQAQVWKNSQKIMSRNTRVVYYDCTNYYFEIEDNDLAKPDADAPNRCVGIRRRGKSKEHRPNPIVQMGMLMDSDGIPLSFIIFPGNESEQPTLKKVEEMIADKFGLNDFIISTDAGLSSEDNRRYNMTENREYIAVQSLPSLSEADQAMALDPKGWHIAFRDKHLSPINPENPSQDTFNLKQINLGREKDTTFYKEIIVSKYLNGKKSTARDERVIVTYNHGFALYLKQKREERLKVAEKIVKQKQVNSRASQQDPRNYVDTVYYTPEGEVAEGITMSINTAKIAKEERFDGFYAYGTSLDDDAIDVLRARSFHYEIEHLFRTTKSHLEARPVYLRREERIRSHFLVCFLSMVIIKMLQKQINMPDVSIDRLIQTLRSIKFDYFKGYGYRPLFERNNLTDRLQEVAQVNIDTQIVEAKTMRAMYRAVNKS
jgi:transposase